MPGNSNRSSNFLICAIEVKGNISQAELASSTKSYDAFRRRYLEKYQILDLKLKAWPCNIGVALLPTCATTICSGISAACSAVFLTQSGLTTHFHQVHSNTTLIYTFFHKVPKRGAPNFSMITFIIRKQNQGQMIPRTALPKK